MISSSFSSSAGQSHSLLRPIRTGAILAIRAYFPDSESSEDVVRLLKTGWVGGSQRSEEVSRREKRVHDDDDDDDDDDDEEEEEEEEEEVQQVKSITRKARADRMRLASEDMSSFFFGRNREDAKPGENDVQPADFIAERNMKMQLFPGTMQSVSWALDFNSDSNTCL
ncbi:unnamed protein product [Dibothriocephalus latus]|uniref:Uncharacterized protein n=1 Tax=Dibothriocephalus latus TaxID=60516 RepID=A0A3P7MD49_DIBLA|nr:unnamed protein product [Dibothriocephalus latus]